MIARLLIVLLLLPSPLWAAIAYVDEVCHADSITPGNTIICVLVNQMDAGNPTFFLISKDNTGTTDSDHIETTSMTDPAGNIYSKICEFTNGQGAAGAGITASLWMTLPTANLGIGQTVTAQFSGSITARAMASAEFTVGGGNTLQIQGGCQTLANDGADAGSIAISGLSSAETLFLRAIAFEGRGTSSGSAFAALTASYTEIQTGQADNGDDSSSASIAGEFRIVTATGSTSDPTLLDTNDDNASIFAAFREVSATPSTRRRGSAWGD